MDQYEEATTADKVKVSVKVMTHTQIPPLRATIALDDILKQVLSANLDTIIEILNRKNIVVWPININDVKLYVLKDFEARYKDLIWASQLGYTNVIALFFNINYSIKLFRERDLYRIVAGFLVHDAYEGVLKLTFPDIESEVKIHDHELGVVGVADLVSNNYVIEIKLGKGSKRHELQLAAYMKALKKYKGYLVYPDNVVEIEYTNSLVQKLVKAVAYLKRLRNIVLNHDLRYIASKFTHSYIKFKQIYGVEPEKLVKVLEKEGFI